MIPNLPHLRLIAWRKGPPIYHIDFRRNGKRITRSLRTRDPQEAEVRYWQVMAELQVDREPAQQALTVSQLQGRAIPYLQATRAAKTARLAKYAFKSFLGVADDVPIDQVDRSTVDAWRIEVAGAKAPATVNVYTALLSVCWDLAVSWNLTESNPFAKLPKIRSGPRKIRYLTPDQVAAVLPRAEQESEWFGVAVRLGLYCGLRISEAMTLTPDHIQGAYLQISGKSRREGEVAIRTIPMVDEVKAPLLALADSTEGPWLFPGDEAHLDPGSVGTRFSALCKDVGVKATFHQLRHTFAARLLSAGVPIQKVSEWLGHASWDITQRYYGHLIPGSGDDLISAVVLETPRKRTKKAKRK